MKKAARMLKNKKFKNEMRLKYGGSIERWIDTCKTLTIPKRGTPAYKEMCKRLHIDE